MINLIILVLFCIIFGVFPIYLLLSKYELNLKTKLIFSLGFSPVLIALLNIITVVLNLEDSTFKYLLLIIPILINYKSLIGIRIQFDSKLWLVIFISIITGGVYCIYAFPNVFFVPQQPYADVEFNLGLIQELKHNFLPQDPYWRSDNSMIYHFLGNIFYASISNYTGISVFNVYELGNVFLALNLFIIFGLMGNNKNYIANLLISLFFLTFSFAHSWVLLGSFHAHLSVSASTFYWSLPTFFASIILWKECNLKRKSFSISRLLIVAFTISFSVVFFKSTLIIPFLLLEFVSFVKFIKNKKVYTFSKIFENFNNLFRFTLIPFFSISAIYIMAFGSNGKLFFGVESRDLSYFDSWSILYPISLLFLAPLFYIIFNFKSKITGGNYLLVALVNLIMFFIIIHEGFSDVYFGFNALLLILIFFLESEFKFKLIKVGVSYAVSGLLFFFILRPAANADFSFQKIKNKIEYYSLEKDSVFCKKVTAFELIGQNFENQSLMIVDTVEHKDFSIPAYMGVSTWNGCNSYTHSTINSYTIPRSFLARQKFIPDYVTDKPRLEDYKTAYNSYLPLLIIDSLAYEDPKNRLAAYNNLVFGNWGSKEGEKFLLENGITHIYVKSQKVTLVNNWISSLPRITGTDFIVFEYRPQ